MGDEEEEECEDGDKMELFSVSSNKDATPNPKLICFIKVGAAGNPSGNRLDTSFSEYNSGRRSWGHTWASVKVSGGQLYGNMYRINVNDVMECKTKETKCNIGA